MNDPTRWRKDPSRRPAGSDLLLRGVRRPRPPETGELARLGALIDDIPRRSAVSARRFARFTSAAVAAATLLALGTGVWAWRGHRQSPATDRDPVLVAVDNLKYGPAPARDLPVPTAEPPAAAPAMMPRAERRTAVRAASVRAPHRDGPAHAAVDSTPADTLAREIALIDAARGDLAAAPARALTALDSHRREFPRGQLAAEREFLAVEALRRMNRIDEARRRAAELEVRYPTSSYAARASRLLESSAR